MFVKITSLAASTSTSKSKASVNEKTTTTREEESADIVAKYSPSIPRKSSLLIRKKLSSQQNQNTNQKNRQPVLDNDGDDNDNDDDNPIKILNNETGEVDTDRDIKREVKLKRRSTEPARKNPHLYVKYKSNYQEKSRANLLKRSNSYLTNKMVLSDKQRELAKTPKSVNFRPSSMSSNNNNNNSNDRMAATGPKRPNLSLDAGRVPLQASVLNNEYYAQVIGQSGGLNQNVTNIPIHYTTQQQVPQRRDQAERIVQISSEPLNNKRVRSPSAGNVSLSSYRDYNGLLNLAHKTSYNNRSTNKVF